MKKHVTTRKKKTLTPQWVHDTEFVVVPTQYRPDGCRVSKDYTILISANKGEGNLSVASTAPKI